MDKISAVNVIREKLIVSAEEADKIIEKSIAGGEISESFGVEDWLNNRFIPNLVFIDETGYSKMCVDALKILSRTAATDFGSSRQRDLGQLWADMTRGYLGEYAFLLFLNERWHIKANLGHEVGSLQEFLPMDIHQIRDPNAEYRTPKIKLSVKTTKWNGIWFDIPGDQFSHSDIHALVKVGAGRDHLFAFFKSLSVFKDKVLKRGEDVGVLSSNEADALYNDLPSFKPIPAYICGFVEKDDSFESLPYRGRKKKKHYTISSWNGPINPGDLAKIKEREAVPGDVKFEGIGDFAHDRGYLFNTGILKWKGTEWKRVCEKL